MMYWYATLALSLTLLLSIELANGRCPRQKRDTTATSCKTAPSVDTSAYYILEGILSGLALGGAARRDGPSVRRARPFGRYTGGGGSRPKGRPVVNKFFPGGLFDGGDRDHAGGRYNSGTPPRYNVIDVIEVQPRNGFGRPGGTYGSPISNQNGAFVDGLHGGQGGAYESAISGPAGSQNSALFGRRSPDRYFNGPPASNDAYSQFGGSTYDNNFNNYNNAPAGNSGSSGGYYGGFGGSPTSGSSFVDGNSYNSAPYNNHGSSSAPMGSGSGFYNPSTAYGGNSIGRYNDNQYTGGYGSASLVGDQHASLPPHNNQYSSSQYASLPPHTNQYSNSQYASQPPLTNQYSSSQYASQPPATNLYSSPQYQSQPHASNSAGNFGGQQSGYDTSYQGPGNSYGSPPDIMPRSYSYGNGGAIDPGFGQNVNYGNPYDGYSSVPTGGSHGYNSQSGGTTAYKAPPSASYSTNTYVDNSFNGPYGHQPTYGQSPMNGGYNSNLGMNGNTINGFSRYQGSPGPYNNDFQSSAPWQGGPAPAYNG